MNYTPPTTPALSLVAPLNATPLASPQARLLCAAQAKLLDEQVPQLIRLTAFLRLSCAALDTPGAYAQLQRALYQSNPQWMNTCEVSNTGRLHSTDLAIQALLTPILQLHSSSDE